MMDMIKLKLNSGLVCVLISLIAVAGCLPAKQTGTSYSRDEVRAPQRVEIGTVIDATPVMIEGTNTGAGGAIGGAVGGIAGSTAGDGAGRDIIAVLAGTAGAIIGARLEDAVTRANGMEYTIELRDGELISVVQALDGATNTIAVGDTVKMLSQAGTYRITRLNNPIAE